MITSQLKRRETIAEGTIAFYFEKPMNWEFPAGQYVTCMIPGNDSHDFTIASAPHEPNIMIATRMRESSFKRALESMSLGSAVNLDGPFGSFTFHNNSAKPAVFMAGGIGVTPFRSMAKHAVHENLAHTIYLFTSNRHKKDVPFLAEFQNLENQHPRFHYIPTLTKESWEGETGRIDGEMIKRHVADIHAPIYYLCGSPPMVAGMYAVLKNLGVDPDSIRSEEFAGY